MPFWLEIFLSVGAAVVSAAVALFIYHSNAKRREGAAEVSAQEHKRQTETQWRRISDQEEEIGNAKIELAVLKALMDKLPDESTIRSYMEALEHKLESRLNLLASNISTQLENLIERGVHCNRQDCPLHEVPPKKQSTR